MSDTQVQLPRFSLANFASLCKTAGARGTASSTPADVFAQLDELYGGADRWYHSRAHIEDCLAQLAASPQVPHRTVLALAFWFHDAIYDTRASDNEEKSAQFAVDRLSELGADHDLLERIEALILVTRHDAGSILEDEAERLMVDIDLSILGAEPEDFESYDAAIRREYSWVPEDAYRAARLAVLRGFLDRPTLYSTSRFRDELEVRARSNLEAKIVQLQS